MRQKFSMSNLKRENIDFARHHQDFERLRPTMHELSLDPENKNLSLQGLYDMAKKRMKGK